MFEGVRGKGYQGDIALDDITLTHGECILPGNHQKKFSFLLNCKSKS